MISSRKRDQIARGKDRDETKFFQWVINLHIKT